MKKIAFLSHLDLNLYLFRLSWMKALMAKGYDVYAIIPEGEYTERLRLEGIKVINYSICRQSLNPLREIAVIIQLKDIFKKYCLDCLHTFTFKPNVYGSIAGKSAGIPCIINTITGLGVFFTRRGIKAGLFRFLSYVFYRSAFARADRVIFQNRDDYETLKLCLSSRKQAVFIPGTGIDEEYFSFSAVNKEEVSALRTEFRAQDKTVITMIARLYWSKGIKEFAEAAAVLHEKYPWTLFLVVGWPDEGNPEKVPQAFVDRVRRDWLIFTGKRDDVREILYLSDIYVLPSYREGVPRTVLEAMAMEKPVITTDVPGCREAVINGVNGFLVPAADKDSLALGIEKLLLNKDLRMKMGRKGRENVIKNFSDKIIIDKIEQLYDELFKHKDQTCL